MDKFKTYFKNIGIKRFIAMILGNIVLGLGIAVFKYAGMGNDPFSAMNMAASAKVMISYPVFQILINVCFFVIEFIFGKKYIGAGTIVNAVLLGYFVDFFYKLVLLPINDPPVKFFSQLPIMIIGVLVTGLGVSLYQTSDCGISPFDSLSIIMVERWPKIPYFFHRMFTDAFCALVCFLCGGLLGLGTLVCAFGLGPVVHFFTKNFSEKIIRHKVGE